MRPKRFNWSISFLKYSIEYFLNLLIETGISFVKIDDETVAHEYGVDHIPTLVYFENKIPSLYHGDLANEEQVLAWLIEQLSSDMIEDVTDEMLDKLIKKSAHLAVLFCKSIFTTNLLHSEFLVRASMIIDD